MNSIINKAETYQQYLNAFLLEADGLYHIAKSGFLDSNLKQFQDYELFLKHRNKLINSKKLIKQIASKDGLIEVLNRDEHLRAVLYLAHIAACCELFSGWSIPLKIIHGQDFRSYVRMSLDQAAMTDNLSSIATKIQNSDAVRVIQVLRLLGRITLRNEDIRQISFAAGNGTRDIDGVHMVPSVNVTGSVLQKGHDELLVFGRVVKQPGYAVLIDNDKEFMQTYKTYATRHNDWMLALIEDAENAMAVLPDLITERKWKPANFVVGIRIDHRMINDVPKYFRLLGRLIDEKAELIITIGAGYDIDEFRGRKRLIEEMSKFLKLKGMDPIRITMHGGKSLEEARASLAFGTLAFSTYEIMHCSLLKKKLINIQ